MSRVSPLTATVRSPRSGAALFWQHICCIASRAGRTGILLKYGGDKPLPAWQGRAGHDRDAASGAAGVHYPEVYIHCFATRCRRMQIFGMY